MPIQDYSAAELAPRKLTPQEIENPFEVIHKLFDYGHLPQLRVDLWELFKTTVTGTWHHNKATERVEQVYFFERLEKLVEAAYLLHIKDLENTI
jgi:hypothetical protein